MAAWETHNLVLSRRLGAAAPGALTCERHVSVFACIRFVIAGDQSNLEGKRHML